MKTPLTRRLAVATASMGFVVLVTGLTYFAILVMEVRFGPEAERAAAYRETGQFLSGQLVWYQDARIYGAFSLVLALISILLGGHALARITLVISGGFYVMFLFWGDRLTTLFQYWAESGV